MSSIKSQILNLKSWISNYRLISGIILLAAFLRLYRIIDYMTFLGDEGRDVLVVKHILEGKLTLLGPTSSVGGFFLGPIYYYFMAPFLWLFQYNPVGPAIMVALFGIATVWLIYKVGTDFFNQSSGIIAAFLYSISPLVISYSRSSWNPNLMPFFSLLTLYTALKAIEKNKVKYFIFSGVFLGIALQLHYVETFLAVILFIYISYIKFFQKKEKLLAKFFVLFKEYMYILFGFFIGMFPFFAFEVRHGFPNTVSIFNFIFHSKEVGGEGNLFTIIGDVFFRLFGRLVTNFPPSEQISTKSIEITSWYILTLLLGIIVIFIFVLQYYKTFKQKGLVFQKYSLLFLWFFIGIFIFSFYKKSIHDYYFEFMFPLPFLFVGDGLTYLWQRSNLTKLVPIVSLIVLFFINIQGIPFRSEPNRQLKQVETISDFVLSKTGNKPFNFALIAGGNSDHAYRYFFEFRNKKPIIIENSQIDPQRKSVADQLLVVCEYPSCEPLGNSLWEVAGFGRAEIVGVWDVSVVKVYKLVHYKDN